MVRGKLEGDHESVQNTEQTPFPLGRGFLKRLEGGPVTGSIQPVVECTTEGIVERGGLSEYHYIKRIYFRNVNQSQDAVRTVQSIQ